jgi:ribosomal protein S18 acetylase RimI-like enzyme
MDLRKQGRPSDEAAVRSLVEATGMFRPNEVEVAAELVREWLQRGEASGYSFVFADDAAGRLMGYVCFGHITVTLASYDIYWIAVDPSHQGRGIGRQLLAAAERDIAAAGGRQVYLETSGQPIYQSTRNCYLRCGYFLEATMRDFYAPGDDKLVYVRRLV